MLNFVQTSTSNKTYPMLEGLQKIIFTLYKFGGILLGILFIIIWTFPAKEQSSFFNDISRLIEQLGMGSMIIAVFMHLILLSPLKFIIFSKEQVNHLWKEYKEYYHKYYYHEADEEYKENNNTSSNKFDLNDTKYYEYLKFMRLEKNTSIKEIKKRYREMANIYHPDKVAQTNNTDIKKATENMQKLNEAYEYLIH